MGLIVNNMTQIDEDIKYLEDAKQKLFEIRHYFTKLQTENDSVSRYILNSLDRIGEAEFWFEESLIVLRANKNGNCGH